MLERACNEVLDTPAPDGECDLDDCRPALDIVKLLLVHGADVSRRLLGILASRTPEVDPDYDHNGYLSSIIDYLSEVFKVVLRAGCDSSVMLKPDTEPCKIAARHVNICLIEMLYVAGADFRSAPQFINE